MIFSHLDIWKELLDLLFLLQVFWGSRSGVTWKMYTVL